MRTERELVRKILSGVARARGHYGERKILAMLMGQTGDLPPGLATLSTAGLLRQEDSRTIGRWLEAAVAGGLVEVSSDRYRTLSLTALGHDVMTGRARDPDIQPAAGAAGLLSGRRFRTRGRAHRRPRWLDEW